MARFSCNLPLIYQIRVLGGWTSSGTWIWCSGSHASWMLCLVFDHPTGHNIIPALLYLGPSLGGCKRGTCSWRRTLLGPLVPWGSSAKSGLEQQPRWAGGWPSPCVRAAVGVSSKGERFWGETRQRRKWARFLLLPEAFLNLWKPFLGGLGQFLVVSVTDKKLTSELRTLCGSGGWQTIVPLRTPGLASLHRWG